MRIKPVALIPLRRLVGKRRVSRKDKERLFWLVESVWPRAVSEGRARRLPPNAHSSIAATPVGRGSKIWLR
jgi:hypothetical protein